LKRGKQAYKCNSCLYRWVISGNRRRDFRNPYHDWLFGRKTLCTLSAELNLSIPKLTAEFDALDIPPLLLPAPPYAVHAMVDAVFFGREYGFLCFHDGTRIFYAEEITRESALVLSRSLRTLLDSGYRFASFTVDGKRGYARVIRRMCGRIPVQMCLFHQKAIVRRYITDRPKSACGKELKALVATLCHAEPQEFIDRFFALQERHRNFLMERNEKHEFTHGKLRSAYRSVETNLPSLFLFNEVHWAKIHPTNNHLEGTFAHLKEKLLIHRGLRQNRKKKAALYILSQPPKNHPLF
jgi:hypothetical protein